MAIRVFSFRRKYNKFSNNKCPCIAGHTHASTKEAGYCNILFCKLRDGLIKQYWVEIPFELQPGFIYEGKKILPIAYRADFVIKHNDNTKEIVDVKGSKFMITPEFKIKWKMLKHKLKDANYKITLHI